VYARIGVKDDTSRILFSAFASIPSENPEPIRGALLCSVLVNLCNYQGVVMDEKPRLLQDEAEGYDVQKLSKWFASRLDAREVIRNNFKEDNNVSQVSNDRME
jgi:hypothetical protein